MAIGNFQRAPRTASDRRSYARSKRCKREKTNFNRHSRSSCAYMACCWSPLACTQCVVSPRPAVIRGRYTFSKKSMENKGSTSKGYISLKWAQEEAPAPLRPGARAARSYELVDALGDLPVGPTDCTSDRTHQTRQGTNHSSHLAHQQRVAGKPPKDCASTA